jgi:hypothetical protein
MLMTKFWTGFLNQVIFRHQNGSLVLLISTLFTHHVLAQQLLHDRGPASYIPDDDLIVKPVDNTISFYQKYVGSDQSDNVMQARNQLKVWNDNQQFADQYGLSTDLVGSAYFVPTPEEKWDYFKDRYLRYLRRRGEQPFKDMPKNWYQEYRASNEVDTIDEMEARFTGGKAQSPSSSLVPQSQRSKEVSFWKSMRFIFQPRVDQGLVIVGVRSRLIYARAWVGVNGETEVNVQHQQDKIGFRAMFNYYAHSGQYFTSLDQRLAENLFARYTISRDPLNDINDNTLMLLYGKSF